MPIREVHVSEITTYKTCPRMYRYAYVEKIVPKTPSDKLFIGTGVHAGLAAYYSGKDPIAIYNKWLNTELARLSQNAWPDQLKELEEKGALGAKLLEAYAKWAQANDSFKVIAVEQPFAVPIWTPKGRKSPGVRYVGTFDGIVGDVYGNIWLMEHKTYSQFPNETLLRLDEQAGYYLVAANQLFPDKNIVGVVYNVIRKVDPARARGDIIKRYTVLRNQHELYELKKRLYYAYRTITADKVYAPSPGHHCTWRCGYTTLCMAEDDGSDMQELVNALYKEAEDRSVLQDTVSTN